MNQISSCKEFADVRLRVNEKKVLNTLNKDKNKTTIRSYTCTKMYFVFSRMQ